MHRPKPPVRLAAAAFAAALLMGGPGGALAGSPDPEAGARDKLREGAARIMEAIEMMIRSIPTYGAPRVDEHGNIIIPRRGGPLDPAPDPDPGPEQTIEDTPLESTAS